MVPMFEIESDRLSSAIDQWSDYGCDGVSGVIYGLMSSIEWVLSQSDLSDWNKMLYG